MLVVVGSTRCQINQPVRKGYARRGTICAPPFKCHYNGSVCEIQAEQGDKSWRGREGGETCAARFRGDFDAAIRLLIHRVGSAVESKMIVKWFRRTKFED